MKKIKQCRLCGSDQLTDFLDLGKQYLADFRKTSEKTPAYPLVACFCESCTLVQLKHTTPQHEMYHDRYGFKSGISNSIKEDLDNIVTHAFQYQNDPEAWLDIASNDGTLLSYVPDDVFRVGVDPVTFLCREAKDHADVIINDYFSYDVINLKTTTNRTYDVITSISCFYDMPDPNKFVSDVKQCLSASGVWIIQQNYLLTTMQLSAVDNFCHEHLEYYNLKPLELLLAKHGLEVNEVQLSTVNGGSIRTVVSRVGTYDIDESVYTQRKVEEAYGISEIETYRDFASRVLDELNKLRNLLINLKSEDKTVYILAASTRGSTIWQSAGIDDKLVVAAVERNPNKVGRWFTPIGIKIISEERFREINPDYAIIGPWFFADEIIDREQAYLAKGGKLITPLPTLEIIGE